MAPRNAEGPSGKSPNPGQPKPRPGWRDKSTKAPQPTAASTTPGWSKAKPVQPAQPPTRKLRRIGLTVVALVMFAAWVNLVLFRNRAIPIYTLEVAQYTNSEIPPNAWAKEDLQGLMTFADDGIRNEDGLISIYQNGLDRSEAKAADGAIPKDGKPAASTASALQLTPYLLARPLGGPDFTLFGRKGSRIIYVTAHGVTDGDKPCLLAHDSDPLKPSTWYPLQNLLQEIKDSNDGGGEVNTLLILDCNRLDYVASLGVVFNHFAEATRELVKSNDDPRLIVMNSTDLGETAVAAPELQGSLFGHFVRRGLNGEAVDDGVVTVTGLHQYVSDAMDDWMHKHRQRGQRPQLFRADSAPEDFRVAYGSRHAAPSTQAKEKFETWRTDYRKHALKLDDLWRYRDKLQAEAAFCQDPIGWGFFERNLLRLEQLRLAGEAYDKAAGDLETSLVNWSTNSPSPPPVVAYNLPLVDRFAPPPPNRGNPASRPVAGAPDRARDASELRARWRSLVDGQGDRAKVIRELTRTSPAETPDVIELHFLRMLDRDTEAGQSGLDGFMDLAIKTRDAAERAATPRDERALYWTQRSVRDLDKRRREFEDQLFVGPPGSASGEAWLEPELWNKTHEQLRQTAELGASVSEAFQLRDLAWAETPYLIQWLWVEEVLARRMQMDLAQYLPTDERRAERWKRLQEGIDGLHELTKALDDYLEQDGESTAWQEKVPAVKGLKALMDDASRPMFQSSQPLVSTPHSPVALVDSQRFLALPFLSAADRLTLRENCLQAMTPDAPASFGSEAPASPASSSGVREITFQQLPPLARWIGAETADLKTEFGPNSLARGAEIGAHGNAVRKRLLELRAMQPNLEQVRGATPAFAPKLRDISLVRQSRSKADQLARIGAPLVTFAAEINPTAELRDFDLWQLMLWQAERTMDDFWGPADQGAEPYFARVAQEYLSAATKCSSGKSPDKNYAQRMNELYAQRLNERREAAEALPTTDAAKLALSNRARQDISLKLTIKKPKVDPPAGIAAAFVRYAGNSSQSGELPLTRDAAAAATVQRLAVPLAGAAVPGRSPFDIQSPDGKSASYRATLEGQDLETVLLYRGHRRPQSLQTISGGLEIEYRPVVPKSTTIVVKGDDKNVASIMFIFDCSSSMSENDLRMTDPNTGKVITVPRMSGAKEKLSQIIRVLAQNPAQYRVGLRLYGHLFGFVETKGTKVARSKYAIDHRSPGPDIPGTDVERSLAITNLTPQTRAAIDRTLTEVHPHGATPMYLSIKRAIEEDFADSGGAGRIVVITDGYNYVSPNTPLEYQVTAKGLRGALEANGQKITLDIIGLGPDFAGNLKAKRPEENQQKIDEIRSLAEKHGHGKFYPVGDVNDLLDALKDSLRLLNYDVVQTGSGGRPQGPFELGRTCEVPPIRALHTPFEVAMHGANASGIKPAKVALDGGEGIELYLDSGRLVHRRYDPENHFEGRPQNSPSLDAFRQLIPKSNSKFWVSALTPTRDTGGIGKFKFAIENFDAEKFSPRPAEVWVNITPWANGELQNTVFRFCDLVFQEGTPVPVARYDATAFPSIEECKEVQVEMWFKMEPTVADGIYTLQDLKAPAEVRVADARVRAEVVMADRDDKLLVIVSERDLPPGQLKIELLPPLGQPDNKLNLAIHRYELGQHEFQLPKSEGVDDKIFTYRVKVTSFPKLSEGAAHCTFERLRMGK